MAKLFNIVSIILTYIIVFQSFLYSLNAVSDPNILLIQSTTSTRDSGFYKYIIPKFEDEYNIKAYVVAVGTGQALKNAKNCDGDILIVHSRELEEKFVEDGFGTQREDLMYNDYIIVGPKAKRIKTHINQDVIDIFENIIDKEYLFVSRGDNSGTYLAELNIWDKSSVSPESLDNNLYIKTGQGMGPTLNVAIGLNALTFTDRATWSRFKNKRDHVILFEHDPMLLNQYGIIKINPDHCKNINHAAANKFFSWILSDAGQKLISEYRVNDQVLFRPGSIYE